MPPILTFLSTINDKYLIHFQIVIKETQVNNFCKFSLNYFPKRNTLPRSKKQLLTVVSEKRTDVLANQTVVSQEFFSSYVYFGSWSTASCLSGSLSGPENFFISPTHSKLSTQNAKGHAASMTSFFSRFVLHH